MSLLIAIPTGLAAAAAYGVSMAIQHDVAYTGTGRASFARLTQLLQDRKWLLAMGGNAVGLILQVIAQATGPIVVIQPLLVLAVVVALPVAWRLGGPRPCRSDYWACIAVLVSLAVFFVVAGDPGRGRLLEPTVAGWVLIASFGAAVFALITLRHRSAPLKAAVTGAVAGGLFGVVGILLNQVSWAVDDHGLSALWTHWGWLSSLGLLSIGAVAMVLTQVSFQVGELGASFPANQSAAPVVAVILGGALMHERLPLSAGELAIYSICLVAIVYGTILLARVHQRSVPKDESVLA